jgi:transcriptional regulator with XRE-family HTH domain
MNNEAGLLLASIRGLKRMTQAELAKISDVPKPYISYAETGRMALSEKHTRQIEAALGVRFADVQPAFLAFAAKVNNGQPDA